jgi:hypothetical protein
LIVTRLPVAGIGAAFSEEATADGAADDDTTEDDASFVDAFGSPASGLRQPRAGRTAASRATETRAVRNIERLLAEHDFVLSLLGDE